jgi:hypothetical protein
VRALRRIPLPTVDEVRREIPRLLAQSGELSAGCEVWTTLVSAWSNIDFEPKLGRFGALDRAFIERQIERTHRDGQLGPSRPSPWFLTALGVAPLTDWPLDEREGSWSVLTLEVPVFTVDRRRASLRGQRADSKGLVEDFEHWLEKVKGRWKRS